MRLTTDEMAEFINFIRRANNECQLSNIECWGSGDTFSSSDEMG